MARCTYYDLTKPATHQLRAGIPNPHITGDGDEERAVEVAPGIRELPGAIQRCTFRTANIITGCNFETCYIFIVFCLLINY